MAVVYRVYQGDSSGGPVDYTAIVATVSGLSYAAAALGLGTTTRFAVRSYDNVALVEDDSVDAEVTIVVDGSGADATNAPRPIRLIRARAAANASVIVEWSPDDPTPARTPTGYRVYGGTPTVSYGSPLATVAHSGFGRAHRATLTGLTSGATYQVAVRPYNANGEQTGSTLVVAVVPDSSAPPAVEGLAGTASY